MSSIDALPTPQGHAVEQPCYVCYAMQAVEPAELALPALAAGIRGGPSLFSSLSVGLVLAEAGVAVLTKSIPLSAIAAVPLLGGALALSTVAGVLGDLKNGAISIPVRSSSSSASSGSYSGAHMMQRFGSLHM